MTLKSILLGAAASLVAVTGARAADAVVVIPEPEPVEYVRVCDVYGAGYFYIPGTETCLQLSGYYRYDIHYTPAIAADPVAGTPASDEGYFKIARFAPSFTVKQETDWGTLTGHATIFFDWTATPPVPGYGTVTDLDHMYLEIAGIRLGKGDTPYARFLGYGPTINYYDGAYGFNNSSELSYTYVGSNGLSIIVAAVEDADFDWTPDAEAGVNLVQGWGSIGAIAGYDESDNSWGAKFVARLSLPNMPVSANLHVFYSSPSAAGGTYTIADPDGTPTTWSVLLGLDATLSERVAVNTAFQWFDTDGYYIAANMPINIAGSLTMTPEIAYYNGPINGGSWNGLLRFQLDY